jgi:hypothetical protein
MALPTLTAKFAEVASLPKKEALARWLVAKTGTGSISEYWSLPEKYILANIAVAYDPSNTLSDYISLKNQWLWSSIYNQISTNAGYVASGTGLSPNINGSRFTITQESLGGYPVFFDSSSGMYLWYSSTVNRWVINTNKIYGTPIWRMSVGTNAVGNYTGVGYTGVVIISKQTDIQIDWDETLGLGYIAAALRNDDTAANVLPYIQWPTRYQLASIITSIEP